MSDDEVVAFDMSLVWPNWVGSRFDEFCRFALELRVFLDMLKCNLGSVHYQSQSTHQKGIP